MALRNSKSRVVGARDLFFDSIDPGALNFGTEVAINRLRRHLQSRIRVWPGRRDPLDPDRPDSLRPASSSCSAFLHWYCPLPSLTVPELEQVAHRCCETERLAQYTSSQYWHSGIRWACLLFDLYSNRSLLYHGCYCIMIYGHLLRLPRSGEQKSLKNNRYNNHKRFIIS